MRYKMNLQLFKDGAGAGSAGQGENAGTGNGSQGTAGSASGAHSTGTYTYEQLEEIASARVERSERAALVNFFRSQGMTESDLLPEDSGGMRMYKKRMNLRMFELDANIIDRTGAESLIPTQAIE